MRRQITALVLTFLTITTFGQRTILFKPFIDDHKIFSYNDLQLGFINCSDCGNEWKFCINLFDSKAVSVKQISDSLLLDCKDSIALKILKSWHKLSVDTISIKQTDAIYDLTMGVNNIYNADKSGVTATIYFNVLLLYDNRTKKKNITRIKYLTITKHDD
jgi:hypothetical protein